MILIRMFEKFTCRRDFFLHVTLPMKTQMNCTNFLNSCASFNLLFFVFLTVFILFFAPSFRYCVKFPESILQSCSLCRMHCPLWGQIKLLCCNWQAWSVTTLLTDSDVYSTASINLFLPSDTFLRCLSFN